MGGAILASSALVHAIIIMLYPFVKTLLQPLQACIDFTSEDNPAEIVRHGFKEGLNNAV
jgi:hypothetical protein